MSQDAFTGGVDPGGLWTQLYISFIPSAKPLIWPVQNKGNDNGGPERRQQLEEESDATEDLPEIHNDQNQANRKRDQQQVCFQCLFVHVDPPLSIGRLGHVVSIGSILPA